MSRTTITLPWGMVLMGHSPRTWWVGVAPGGRHLVAERVHPEPPRRYRRRIIPLPRTRHGQDLAAEHEALNAIARALEGAHITAGSSELETLLLGVAAERGIGEPGTRASARTLCPPPWTITIPVPIDPPIVPGEIRALAPSVFPLWGTDGGPKRAKAPRLRGSWIGGRPVPPGTTPTAYGIDCAWSELLVVDLDRHGSGVDGLESWERWIAERVIELPPTLEVTTPSGGRHIYYVQDGMGAAPIGSAVAVLPGVDLRGGHVDGDGAARGAGYVVGPGSRVVLPGGEVREYRIVADHPVAMLPDDLAEALAEQVFKGKPKRRGGAGRSRGAADGPPPPAPMVDAENLDRRRWDRLRRMEQAIRTCAPGTRHDTINAEVYGSVMAGCPPELTEAIALEAIRQAGIVDHDHEVGQAITDALATREAEEVTR